MNHCTQGFAYRVEFFLSLLDSVNFAVRNVGVHLSSPPHVANIDSILSLTPQVQYTDDVFLTDKEGWMRISGSFIAEGGEKYIAIGNFDDDANTDTFSVPNGGAFNPQTPEFWNTSAYFIDDVSVMADTTTGINELGFEEPIVSLYPNPNTGSFTVWLNIESEGQAIIDVESISGKRIFEKKLMQGSNLIEMDVAEGLYIYRIVLNDSYKWSGKIAISID